MVAGWPLTGAETANVGGALLAVVILLYFLRGRIRHVSSFAEERAALSVAADERVRAEHDRAEVYKKLYEAEQDKSDYRDKIMKEAVDGFRDSAETDRKILEILKAIQRGPARGSGRNVG